tara:strand:+ start:3801 stop:4562 length:762 start_codon:yes stop_codon:yes gene_type:complete
MHLSEQMSKRQANHPNSFTKFGKKCFSQADEDGLTIEIIKRLNLDLGTFAEFGVGDGMENNSLILLALGWNGFWVGGEDLVIDISEANRLHYQKAWITNENCCDLYRQGLKYHEIDNVNVLMLDLDGNDLFFCESLLADGASPELFIVEYNAKFPPPVRFSIDYDPKNIWEFNDYQGASLMSFVDLFAKYGYSLICCNAASGANAFFVKDSYKELFPEVPAKIEQIYTPPYFHLFANFGHPPSVKTIQCVIKN